MKKIFLLLVCGMCFINLSAQVKRDFNYYNKQIDSLIYVYSVDTLKNIQTLSRNFHHSHLTDKEKKKLISRIEKMFKQKEYVNLYRLGHRLLYNMQWVFPQENSLEIKQALLETYLQYYFYPGVNHSFIGGDDFSSALYYTPKAKKRTKEILEEKKTEAEYEAEFLFNQSANLKYPERGLKEAKQIMKKQNIEGEEALKQIRDSLLKAQNIRFAEESVKSLHIQPGLVKMIGLLKMKECMPVLKANLQLCVQENCRDGRVEAYRYALAKLGDEEQRQYILDNLMDVSEFDEKDFIYFRDDEIIWKYVDINYGFGKVYPVDSQGNMPADVKIMDAVYPFVKNVPEELVYVPHKLREMKNFNQWAKSFYEWLMENRDTIEFDYDGEKKWFWGL